MSVLTTVYPVEGIPITLPPPRAGIYYASVAIYNQLGFVFSVQNGVNQNQISPNTAALFGVPTTGAPPQLTPPNISAPYGSWLGPIAAVWFEPGETPGSYPSPLGALGGIVQWTIGFGLVNTPFLGVGSVVYVASGQQPAAIAITVQFQLSAGPVTVNIIGVQSGDTLGTFDITTSAQYQTFSIPITQGTGDTAFEITANNLLRGVIISMVFS